MSAYQAEAARPEQVGQLYDALTGLSGAVMGENLHFGYWKEGQSTAETSFERAAQQLTDLVIDRLCSGPGAVGSVLDVGCGVGGPAVRVHHSTGARVVGITVSAEQVSRAGEKARSAALEGRVTFRQADAMVMDFPTASFDAVMAIESIVHMPDRLRVFQQIARVLRPGGRLVLTDFFSQRVSAVDEDALLQAYWQRFMAAPAPCMDAYVRTVSEAGLLVEEVRDLSRNCLRPTIHAFRPGSRSTARRWTTASALIWSPLSTPALSLRPPASDTWCCWRKGPRSSPLLPGVRGRGLCRRRAPARVCGHRGIGRPGTAGVRSRSAGA
ncbi:SAM-dependent methyltransferase [Streptomyces albireticuli]|uniref:SAM-dependent methyltransferase n=1 Tax=Streptomyces albireticuli TaxID=1940 RepID=A0A2A2D1H0_9ACTN|nr:methyltransferase domain-containing protein [Streptomyces albireticuli]MCD9145725.1 methyltransferase domain-containing protein [Streptomyces albireticuli]MCD9165543.1 methyltransferase domain-containing protein [Streptomyces albireticuli]MCD9195934.1 methyltransferase domain-containing protein [Streptomyces albireticuli]PAU45172.1 SAM-dependent methyltransferase [Streptomyces albireticuli]